MDESKNIIVIFTEKADALLSDMLRKYNLQETEREAFEKFKEKKLPNIVIINHLARDFVKGVTSEKDIISSLQKELNMDQKTAQNTTREIINNLIPLLEKTTEEELKKRALKNLEPKKPTEEIKSGNEVLTKIKPPIGIPSKGEPINNKIIQKEEQTKRSKTINKLLEENDQTIKSSPTKTGKKNKEDSYREPVE